MTQVFISYSRKDLAFVERLAKDLRAAGLDVWYDLSGLEIGTHWGKDIQYAILQSQYFLVVLSPNSNESEWVEREFLYAGNHKLKIVPLVYKTCDLPMWSLNMHFIDMRGKKYALHLDELLKVLGVRRMVETGVEPAIPIREAVPALPKVAPRPREKRRLSPAWIIAPLVLMAAVALGIWGIPPLVAKLTPAATPTHTNAPARMFTPSMTSTIAVTPTSTRPGPTPTKIPSPTPLAIGSTRTRQKDGMVMVYVPEGNFSMGSNYETNEGPVHTVYLDAYWIDRTEVTNAMYALCQGEGACWWEECYMSRLDSNYYSDPQFSDYPVACMSWYRARDYCSWAGGRLPTEAEWEKAARGTDARKYPWEDSSPTCLLANLGGCNDGTVAVGSYPDGASPYGALDMAGNVWEWVNDWYEAAYYSRSPLTNPTGPASGSDKETDGVLRGGSWFSSGYIIRSTYRGVLDHNNSSDVDGFRCAVDVYP